MIFIMFLQLFKFNILHLNIIYHILYDLHRLNKRVLIYFNIKHKNTTSNHQTWIHFNQ